MIASRYMLSKKDRRKLANKVGKELGIDVERIIVDSEKIEVAKLRLKDYPLAVIVDGKPFLFEYKGRMYPLLIGLVRQSFSINLPRVFVDKGAVPHILNGADVMVPGIVKVEGVFDKGGIVLIADYEKERIFAVGEALMSSSEILSAKKGRAVRNIHYAGDNLWKISLEL